MLEVSSKLVMMEIGELGSDCVLATPHTLEVPAQNYE